MGKSVRDCASANAVAPETDGPLPVACARECARCNAAMIEPSSDSAVAASKEADDGGTETEDDDDDACMAVAGSAGAEATAVWYLARASSAWVRSV